MAKVSYIFRCINCGTLVAATADTISGYKAARAKAEIGIVNCEVCGTTAWEGPIGLSSDLEALIVSFV